MIFKLEVNLLFLISYSSSNLLYLPKTVAP